MPEVATAYKEQFSRIFSRNPQLSNIRPSDWAEQNIVIPGKGKLNYDFNPYCRKIIDMLAPDHPARKIAVMKGSQITFSSGVIMPALGYIIKEDPHNTILMVGTTDLIKPAGEKLDLMIHGARLQDYITATVKRKRATKTGDTDELKTFANGYIKLASNSNPKSIAQIDLARILLDDFDAMQGKSKSAGSFMDLIEMRAASNLNDYKLMMISTPLLRQTSNIEPAFLAGNQERYFVACECCHERILIKWTVAEGEVINPLTGETAKGQGGIHYELDNHGRLKKRSVGYVCYLCSGYFQDKNKQQMLRDGIWTPTALPISDDYFSFHISSLYAPVGMFDWTYYAGKWIEANPQNQPRDEAKTQVLVNTCFGETYEGEKQAPEAKAIQKNTRSYDIGTIPEKLSLADGNGRIVLLTLAADMNGVMEEGKEDVRLDYEVVAWAENGATYSVLHGSLGTFVPRENTVKHKADRERWTYDFGKERSVWPLLDGLLQRTYDTDTGRVMPILFAGLDCGFFSNSYAYPYLERTNSPITGLKGDKEGKYTRHGIDVALVKPALERDGLWILQVGLVKDKLADYMKLRWHPDTDDSQPPNFMNFPHPGRFVCPVKKAWYDSRGLDYAGDELYGFNNYFSHFEAEHRVEVKNNDGTQSFRWVKKSSTVLNHSFDVRIYNIAMREVMIRVFAKSLGKKDFTWKDYVEMAVGGE